MLASGLNIITPYNDYQLGNTYIAGNHFPVGAVFVLLVLALLNLLVHRLRRRPLLAGREIAVIYIIIMITSGIPSSGLLRYMIPSGTTPYYYANPGNKYEVLVWGHIPTWMAVSEPEAVAWFWEGLPEGVGVPWSPWIRMLSHWAILFGAFWLMMISLAALVRKQWADRERLAFPLVQFPLEVLREDSRGATSFFANRLVWIGAGAVFIIHILKGLAHHFPAVPNVPTFFDISNSFPDRPFNAFGPVYIGIFFSAIGFGYLLSTEVAAGFWVAVIFMKVQGMVLSMAGLEGDSAWGGTISEITNHEEMGGVLAMAAVLLWLLRGSLIEAFRKAFSRAPDVDDSREPMSYRIGIYGLLISLIVAGLWLHAAGMTWTFIPAFLLIFVCLCLVLTRIIAEAGMLMIHFSFMPVDYLLMAGGSTALGPGNLTALTFVDCALTFDLREFLMPSVLNGFRMAELSHISTRKLVPVIVLVLAISVAVSVPAYLITIYKPGLLQLGNYGELYYHPTSFFNRLGSRLQNPVNPNPTQYISMVVGAGMVVAMSWLRLNFVWWPVHPLGFVMATSWASLNLWFSLFLGWFFKLITVHYSGLRGYREFRPLFLGLILGDVMGAVLWNTIGFFTGIGFMTTVN